MRDYTFQGAEGSPCPHCHEEVELDMTVCPSCKQEVYQRYDALSFILTFFEGHIIDARAGGLVLGRNHNEDDIPMLSVMAPGIFQSCGMMMGGEFILNREATAKHKNRIEEINAYLKDSPFTPLTSISITEKTRVFNTNGIKGELIMFVDNGQFVVNRAATAKYFKELEELNNSVTHELTDESGC